MPHNIYKVTDFELVAPLTLRIRFDDGLQRTINFEPVLAGDIYGALNDPEFFRRVRIDPEIQTLVWSNGADFDPETLHDWPEQVGAMVALTRRRDFQHA